MMRGAGLDPLAAPTGGSPFPPPGNPNPSPTSDTATTPATPGGGSAPSSTTPAQNLFGQSPFGPDPTSLLQLLGAGGPGFGSGASPFSSAPPSTTDTRPPEERFQVQLQVRNSVVRHH
jgi:ubiquilin